MNIANAGEVTAVKDSYVFESYVIMILFLVVFIGIILSIWMVGAN